MGIDNRLDGARVNATDSAAYGSRLQGLVNNVCDVIGMRRNLKEMSFMADFLRAVNASIIAEEVLAAAAQKIYQYFRFNLMVVHLTTGTEKRSMAFTPLDIVECPDSLGAILDSNSGMRIPDVKGYASLGLDRPEGSPSFGSTNYLELPLHLGSVTVYSEFNLISHFSDSLLQGMMEGFATSLRNSLEYEKVKELSMRDGLTGLFNRRVLEEMLELEGRKRQVTPISLLVMDLDNFKQINDTYGHPAGDVVLQTAARVLRESTRGSDLIARTGGEEFSVLLQTQSPLGALEVGERIRANLARTLVTYNGRQIRISGSIGVAHRSVQDPCGVKELVQRADQAMYEAKRQGKNQVCVYRCESPEGAGQAEAKTVREGARVVRIK